MQTKTMLAVAAIAAILTGPAMAEGTSNLPENTASPAKEADKMKTGGAAEALPNSSNPGSNAGADGNQTQDSRTIKTRDR